MKILTILIFNAVVFFACNTPNNKAKNDSNEPGNENVSACDISRSSMNDFEIICKQPIKAILWNGNTMHLGVKKSIIMTAQNLKVNLKISDNRFVISGVLQTDATTSLLLEDDKHFDFKLGNEN